MFLRVRDACTAPNGGLGDFVNACVLYSIDLTRALNSTSGLPPNGEKPEAKDKGIRMFERVVARPLILAGKEASNTTVARLREPQS